MEAKADIIKRIIMEAFPVSKLRCDLFDFLTGDKSFERNADGYAVPVYNESTKLIDYVTINENDHIEIIMYKYIHEFDDIYFHIIIGIGEFTNQEIQGLFTVSKCLGELRYNHDFKYFDIEFSISNINKERC